MADTFTKVFSSITESTVWGEPHATRIVWVTLLAKADRHGCFYGSIPGLAHLARVTLAECETALAAFYSPDPYSRTPDNDGRRIEQIAGGWLLLNHAKYRARELRDDDVRREQNREAKRRQREREQSAGVSNGQPMSAGVSQESAQADADAEADTKKDQPPRAPENPEPPKPEDLPADKIGGFEGHSQEDVDKAIEDGKKHVEAAKALKAAGCVDVHSTRPELVQALADGIAVPELVAIAEQHRGKPLVYLVSTARRRRLDATATAGSTSPGKPEPKCNPDGMSPRITDPDEIKRRQAEADAAGRQQYPELYAHLNGASA